MTLQPPKKDAAPIGAIQETILLFGNRVIINIFTRSKAVK
ncbi:hypothetical protein FCR2A7T_16970 [Flavobacterium cauense R2A-7]|nr:hypothetical protein FCR2A7T_16970 [Flavobacterium cauense R2A-7]